MSTTAILGLLGLAIQLALSVVQWLSGKGQLAASNAEGIAAGLNGVLDEIRKAQTIRETVRSDAAADPQRLRAPDPNSRD